MSQRGGVIGIGFTWLVLGAALLFACRIPPKGAKNWLFSIGPQTYAAALGDLDGDGDLDAYLANGENEVPVPDTVWLNDGSGRFTDSGQQIGERESHDVILADLDRDGRLDALVASTGGIALYSNQGQGVFKHAWLQLVPDDGDAYLLAPAVGDVNGDGRLDILGGGCCGSIRMWDDGRREVVPSNDSLWISDGEGGYTDSGQKFDTLGTYAIALGDLDGDGDLDAWFANSSSLLGNGEDMDNFQADTIWLNDGQGVFTMSSQMLSKGTGSAVVLGDLDGDGDLDALIGNQDEDEVWLNQGGRQDGLQGEFRLESQLGLQTATRALSLVDVDGDGDLDVLAAGGEQAVIWLNDGLGRFTAGSQFGFEPQHALATGDLNGDGSADIFAGSVNHGILVWLNDGQGIFAKQ